MNRTPGGTAVFILFLMALATGVAPGASAQEATATEHQGLKAEDVFDLEFATDPQISPDGERVVFVRNRADIVTDTRYTDQWIVDVASGEQRALTSGKFHDSSPRWSPDGQRIAFTVRWMKF